MRSRRFRLLALVLAATTAVLACSDDAEEAVGGSTTTTAPAESTTTTEVDEPALDPAALGPYPVGRKTVTVVDDARDGRGLTVDVWYPTDVEDGELSTYSFAPGIEYDSEVALDAPAVSSEGPFPLVVYSHGSGGLRYVATYFTETLASHGFVVVAPDHAGNTTIDQVAGTSDDREVIARNRPEDVSVVISAVLDGTADPELVDAVDGDVIGVTGHSFGGYTTLAIGGGVDELGIEPDERVDALVPMAPAAGLLSDADLAAVDIPTLVLSGTLDDTTPIDPNTTRTADLVSGPTIRADLEGATHQSFTDVCDYTVLLRELPDVSPDIIELVDDQAGTTCDPEVLDIQRAHDLINTYAIAFLLDELTGDERATRVLDADPPAEVELTVAG